MCGPSRTGLEVQAFDHLGDAGGSRLTVEFEDARFLDLDRARHRLDGGERHAQPKPTVHLDGAREAHAVEAVVDDRADAGPGRP